MTSSAASTTRSSTTSASSRARGRRSRTFCSSPSRRPSASSRPRSSRERWSSGCASAPFLVFADAVVGPGLLGPRVLGLWRRLAHQRRHARLRRRNRRRDGFRLLGPGRSAGRRGAQGLRAPGAPAAQRRLRARRRRAAVVRLVRVQRRLRVQHRSELDARVHEHAAHARVRADHVVRPRPHPRPDGDRDRRRHGDRRRLCPHHPGGRLHRPGLGDGARFRRGAALLRPDRLPAADPRGRDARRPRRARPRRLHGNPRSSGSSHRRPGTGSRTAPSTGTSTSWSIRSWPRSRCPRTRSSRRSSSSR